MLPRRSTPLLALALALSLGGGCAFALRAQTQQLRFVDGPVLSGRTAAFDHHRGRLVLFGVDGGTWEYAGSTLLDRAVDPAASPPARQRGAMTYDAVRRHVLLFGGSLDGVPLGDTWTYDGVRWTARPSATAPSLRSAAAITFDSARGTVLLFGGEGQNDTWEHDGTAWTQRSVTIVPVPALAPVMTFDSARGVAVLLTRDGQTDTTAFPWEWTSVGWAPRLRTMATPTSMSGDAIAFDPVRQRTVAVCGVNTGARVCEWDGVTWRVATTLPATRYEPAVWFDPSLGKLVIAGGADPMPNALALNGAAWRSDAWTWDGTALLPLWPDRLPPSRSEHLWLADRPGRRCLLFGGVRGGFFFDDLWAFDGNTWTRSDLRPRPPARSKAGTTYDWLGGRSFVFGGLFGLFILGDLWSFDGSAWLQHQVAGPTPRSGAALAFDAVRQRLVLFGGRSAGVPFGNVLVDQTWEWDGSTWRQLVTPVAPTAREFAAMAYDFVRNQTVLFGGNNSPFGVIYAGDTWEWNGGTWTAIASAAAIGPLTAPTMTMDVSTLRVVLAGRTTMAPGLTGVWDWNGATWTQRLTANGRFAGPIATDFARQRLVVATGNGVAELAQLPATVTEVGAGCGVPVPRFAARARPRLGSPTFGFELGAVANGAAVFGLAFAQGNTALGNGCTLLLDQAGLVPFGAVANGNGDAVLAVPLPASPLLAGTTFTAQGLALDAAAPGGFRMSQALRCVLGD